MIVVILPVCRRTANHLSVYYCFQSDFPKIFHGFSDDTLKANIIIDADAFFDGDVLACRSKSQTVSFRKGIRHYGNRFLRKGVKIRRHTKLGIGNIAAIAVQTAQI